MIEICKPAPRAPGAACELFLSSWLAAFSLRGRFLEGIAAGLLTRDAREKEKR
jgi:hypothetical protein